MSEQQIQSRYPDFSHTGANALAGRYLRMFWQPVFVSDQLRPGQALPITIMNEAFTVYRTEKGRAQVLAPRCAHRNTQLSTGWVEGECLRCFYHGWMYDSSGQCVDQPAEKETLAETIKIRSYPTREYLGLIFAYLGAGGAPEFPHLDVFDAEGYIQAQRRPSGCNFFNQLENSVDEAHINFVHRSSQYRDLGLNREIPVVTGEETGYGIARFGARGDAIRRSHILMPNVMFSMVYYDVTGWTEHLAWRVPVTDESHASFIVDLVHVKGPEVDAYLERRRLAQEAIAHLPPGEDIATKVLRGEMHVSEIEDRPDLVSIQDMVALMGQGISPDRDIERLGRSDNQVALLRRIWSRELRALENGTPLSPWRWPADLNVTNGLPPSTASLLSEKV
jgi:5,5'-dehydrodivanillate O-demethylase